MIADEVLGEAVNVGYPSYMWQHQAIEQIPVAVSDLPFGLSGSPCGDCRP